MTSVGATGIISHRAQVLQLEASRHSNQNDIPLVSKGRLWYMISEGIDLPSIPSDDMIWHGLLPIFIATSVICPCVRDRKLCLLSSPGLK